MSPRKRKKGITARTGARRSHALALATVGAGLLMIARAFQLQVVQGEAWHDVAVSQTTEIQQLPAARGGIFDRHGRPLAISRDVYAAFYAPAEVGDRAEAVERITRILGFESRGEARLLSRKSGWVALGNVDHRTRQRLQEALPRGVHFEPIPARAHPEGRLASELLGALDARGRGATGLERVLDAHLTGTPGQRLARKDAHGATYPVRAGGTPPRPGRDVYLTIDAELQEITEEALGRALAETGATGGDLILADPRSGEILALASVASGRQQRIPAFTDPYEPGSTTKPFLLATLLEHDLVSLDETIDVEGGRYETPHRTITDVHEYDSLTVEEVIRFSSNIGAAKLADRIEDPGLQYAYLRDFGFGTPTGIETASEATGLLRRPRQWSALSQHSLAYGYEMMVTSIQLVAAYGALANDGILLEPTLIREVRDPDGRPLEVHRPRPVRRIVAADVAAEVTSVLAGVVAAGTGDEAALRTIDIAGKTGTSRVSADGAYQSGRYVASFVGYLPADDPKLVVLAKLSDPQSSIYGGGAAAPVSRTVVQAILSAAESGLVGTRVVRSGSSVYDWEGNGEAVSPAFRLASADGGEKFESPRPFVAQPSVLPDLRGLGLREAAARLFDLGLVVECEASGSVTYMNPPPGTRIVRGARVVLR